MVHIWVGSWGFILLKIISKSLLTNSQISQRIECRLSEKTNKFNYQIVTNSLALFHSMYINLFKFLILTIYNATMLYCHIATLKIIDIFISIFFFEKLHETKHF